METKYKMETRCYKELNAARNNGCTFHIDQKLKRNRPWIQDIRKTHFRSGCNLSKRSGAPGAIASQRKVHPAGRKLDNSASVLAALLRCVAGLPTRKHAFGMQS